MLLTDTVPRCRLLAAHGLTSCLSVRTQPLTATGAPSQTSTIPYHTILTETLVLALLTGTVQPAGGSARQTGHVRASTFDDLCSCVHSMPPVNQLNIVPSAFFLIHFPPR